MNEKYQKHGNNLNEIVFNALADNRQVEVNGYKSSMTDFFKANETLTRAEQVRIINLKVGESWLPDWMVQIPVTRIK